METSRRVSNTSKSERKYTESSTEIIVAGRCGIWMVDYGTTGLITGMEGGGKTFELPLSSVSSGVGYEVRLPGIREHRVSDREL